MRDDPSIALSESASNRAPGVAVLLATHNGKPFLEAQVRSILDQGMVSVHLYVSDDSSDDGTLELIRRLADADRRIQVMPPGSFGSAADNFRRLICEVPIQDHDFIALADQDDVWVPARLARAIGIMSSCGTDGYSSDLLAFHEPTDRHWLVRKAFAPRRLDYLFGGASAGCTYVLTSRAMEVVRRALSRSPKPSPGWSHDWLIYAICRSAGLGWSFDPSPSVHYRQHDANAYGARSGWRGAVARLKAVRDGWYRRQFLENGNYLQGGLEEREVVERIRRWSWRDRVWLFRNGPALRRRLRDGVALSLLAFVIRRDEIRLGASSDSSRSSS